MSGVKNKFIFQVKRQPRRDKKETKKLSRGWVMEGTERPAGPRASRGRLLRDPKPGLRLELDGVPGTQPQVQHLQEARNTRPEGQLCRNSRPPPQL